MTTLVRLGWIVVVSVAITLIEVGGGRDIYAQGVGWWQLLHRTALLLAGATYIVLTQWAAS